MLNAVYTMCYKDVLELSPTLLSDIVWDTPEHTQKLKDMIYSKFFNYEIAGETIPEQKLFMTMKFNEYKDYYAEKLNAYEQQINWLDGVISSDSETITEDKSKTFTPRSEYESVDTPRVITTNEDYDLPRSTVSENRPSSKSVSTPTGTNTKTTKGISGDDKTDESNDITRSTDRKSGNPIEQKEKYLKLLRSVYSEFADKFKVCFITLFN